MESKKKAKGLGRGLEALLAPNQTEEQTHSLVNLIAIAQLQAGAYQPRQYIDESALMDLVASIQAQGLLQPIVVRPIAQNRYEIIAGERRFRAAQLAGLSEIPAIVKTVSDKDAAAIALIENIQRENLNALEEAQAIQRLLDEFQYTHEQTAAAIGRSRSAVSNLLRLLQLTKPVQTMLLAGDLEMGHARALLALNHAEQIALAQKAIGQKLSVREVERLSKKSSDPKQAIVKIQKKSRDITRLEEELADQLATPVKIKLSSKGKGELIIQFANLDIFEKVIERLKSEEFSTLN